MGRGETPSATATGRRIGPAQHLPAQLRDRFGVSTGWDPETRTDYRRAVRQASGFSSGAIELSALAADDLPILARYLQRPDPLRDRFSHLSVHAPAKGLEGRLGEVVEQLLELEAETMIFHPDTIGDLEQLRPLGERVVFENMDCRKQSHQDVADLEKVFEQLPKARFCLDVAHAWSVDHSLDLGHRLIDAFGERMAEIHISGIKADGKHRLTRREDLALYRPLLECCPAVPLIFESPYVG